MPSWLQEKPKHQVISACFLKLAALKTYQNQWQTNEQWQALFGPIAEMQSLLFSMEIRFRWKIN
jgi:hypothetical protein